MENRGRIILIAVAGILSAAVIFLLWRNFAQPKKIVVQKQAVEKVAVKKKVLPAVKKKFQNPKVAIVMDDFGYNMTDLDAIFATKLPVTFSILPNLPYSRRVADLARSKGYEVMLHLPLESLNKSASVEPDTIKTGMDEKQILAFLDRDIKSVPGLKGVSNHQGSKATEDKDTMSVILKDLKNRKLYFFDSLVTDKSVCGGLAKSMGVPYACREAFLDNTMTQEYIEKELLSLRRMAFRRGSAIAICHDRKKTIAVLSKVMPELAADGIDFVFLSEMVK